MHTQNLSILDHAVDLPEQSYATTLVCALGPFQRMDLTTGAGVSSLGVMKDQSTLIVTEGEGEDEPWRIFLPLWVTS